MPPTKAPLLPTAKPKHSAFFDPFNSSSTGHQRAENKAGSSTGWRQSRAAKLSVQFRGGGPASKQREQEASNIEDSQMAESPSIVTNLHNPPPSTSNSNSTAQTKSLPKPSDPPQTQPTPHPIFANLTIYINGSTYPLISDHALKHLLAVHGARISIHLGRKLVTHVIIGTPSSSSMRSGAGGGLAAGKMQKEISRVGGSGIKYVGVEWALESVKAGRRLPEARFANVKLSLGGQRTVRENFFGVKPTKDASKDDRLF